MYAPLTLPDAAAWMHTSLMLCMIICDYSRPLWMLSAAARPLLVASACHGCCAARVVAAWSVRVLVRIWWCCLVGLVLCGVGLVGSSVRRARRRLKGASESLVMPAEIGQSAELPAQRPL